MVKSALFISVFCLLYIVGFSQKKSYKNIIGEFVILESDLKFAADCGYFHFVHAIKFKRPSTGNFIIGFIGCPELYGEIFFIKGKTYLVDITNAMQKRLKGTVIINSYKEENLPTYFVTRIIKEK